MIMVVLFWTAVVCFVLAALGMVVLGLYGMTLQIRYGSTDPRTIAGIRRGRR